MILLDIEKIENNSVYYLKDKQTDKNYQLMIEFYDIELPKEGDKLMISPLLLDKNWEGFAQPYAFGKKNSPYGRKGKNLPEEDIIGLHSKGKDIILKRLYG